jgi:hypothetical protein
MKTARGLVISVLFFISCSRHGIAESKAYVRQLIAGTVRSNDNGKQMNSGVSKEYLIYIETDISKPPIHWETAWIEQKPYSIRPVEIVIPNQVIGKTTDGKEVVMNAKKGNRLWQLVLIPTDRSKEDSELRIKINKAKILLIGSWKNKPFTYKVSKEYELQALDFQ